MSGSHPEPTGWFTDLDIGGPEGGAITIATGEADHPGSDPKQSGPVGLR
ncbi:hypothetical protein [Halopenitus persicus]|uniref:Uncharacterized protein n=1 Tax=Halopenitus persicus TaxID=1048396 RepID=A0A1H3DZ33_9EURY|nr:hypothetical protein [Halopenitus persicus]SDX71610.1 hypothetical protein SAMN05216564_101212 [Halopenitus persicus]